MSQNGKKVASKKQYIFKRSGVYLAVNGKLQEQATGKPISLPLEQAKKLLDKGLIEALESAS